MPTSRPRHVLTETDDLARTLDEAAKRWPADRDRRSRLLLHLVEEGAQSIHRQQEIRVEQRLAAVSAAAGALTGSYETDYLERLRQDWPE